MKWLKKAVVAALAVALCATSVITLAACNKTPVDSIELTRPTAEDENKVTYNTFTTVMPSNWNELTYEDNNDTQIMNYIGSSFFEYDYEFDENKGGKFKDGKVNAAAIVKDGFIVKYSAATALEDVTSTVDAKWGYTEEQKTEGGYAWKITFRQDLKWEDGTPIDATDFVYTMQEQLNPDFQNYRASVYYGAVSIIGAKNYVYQGQKGWFSARDAYGPYKESLDNSIIFSLGNSTENKDYGGAVCGIRQVVESQFGWPASYTAANYANIIAQDYVDFANPDEPTEEEKAALKAKAEEILALQGKTFAQIKADATLKATWDEINTWWITEPNDEEIDFFVAEYTFPEVDFGTVGFYSPSKYELVVCFDASSAYKKDNGDLSYLAAYELASFPLVYKAKYEECKQRPASEASKLWTTTYNTSLETSHSWGPYKLTQFQSGKSYTLEKNEYWYGYKLDDNQDQYLVDKIYCEKLEQTNTQWMAFLGGCVDDIGIDVTHSDDYRNSKYAYVTPGSYTFSWHLYGDLKVLKQSGRNNGILAIKDFRKALSLAIDRDEYARRLTTAYQAGYGYLNDTYYYDVVNNGIYRKTDQGKKALLRAYGYTESNGKWSLPGNAQITNMDLDAAYATLKGLNLTQAKELIESAYQELTAHAADYGYDPSKKIQIKFGTSADNDSTRREFNLVNEILTKVTQGTSLEGKVEAVFDASFGSDWSKSFKAGQFELCTSAWGSATFNPCYLIGAYVEKASAFTEKYFDVENTMITVPNPAYNSNDPESKETLTISLLQAYTYMNSPDASKGDLNWKSGVVSEDFRLEVLAIMEERILTEYYSIPTITQFSSTLLGAKFEYIDDNYNTFMSYGGMRYIRPQYTNLEWYNYVVDTMKRDLSTEYKKTAE